MFMLRSGEDDFETLKTIDVMEAEGAVIVAITPNGMAQHVGAMVPHQRFQIWARVADSAHIKRIDAAISKDLYGDDEA